MKSRARRGAQTETRTPVVAKQKERTENQGRPPGGRRTDLWDLSSRSPEHRPGPDSYCWGRRHFGLAYSGLHLCCFLLAEPSPLYGGSPTLPTDHPVTNTTHSFTTLNLSALLGAGHTQSLVSSAGPVWQDLGTLGYTKSQSGNYNLEMSAAYLPAQFILIFVSCYM